MFFTLLVSFNLHSDHMKVLYDLHFTGSPFETRMLSNLCPRMLGNGVLGSDLQLGSRTCVINGSTNVHVEISERKVIA